MANTAYLVNSPLPFLYNATTCWNGNAVFSGKTLDEQGEENEDKACESDVVYMLVTVAQITPESTCKLKQIHKYWLNTVFKDEINEQTVKKQSEQSFYM